MKKFSILILVVIAIVFASCQQNKAVENSKKKSVSDSGSSMKIAYVDTDEFMNRYFFVQVLRKELETETAAKTKTIEDKQKAFEKKGKSYEKDAKYFQEQMQKGSLSEQSAAPIYQKLLEREQQLGVEQQGMYQLQQEYANQLSQKEAQMNAKIFDSLNNYTQLFNKEANYDLILTKNPMTNILVINEGWDITDEIVDGLNARYKEDKE
jgi:outer membrane protein